jgi:hypothetical protein
MERKSFDGLSIITSGEGSNLWFCIILFALYYLIKETEPPIVITVMGNGSK